MHAAAQKDLQRTTIYSADAHEMSFRQVLAPGAGVAENVTPKRYCSRSKRSR
jgi:hypothetical protein